MPYCSECGTLVQSDQQFCPQCGKAIGGAFAPPAPMPYFPMQEETPASTQPLAGYWWRVLGYLIDSILLGVVIAFPLRSANVNVYLAAVLNAAVTFAYGTLLLCFASGQTLGMKVARVHVANVDDGVTITRLQAIRRTALYCALSLLGNLYHYTRYLHPTTQQKLAEGRHALVALVLLVPFIVNLLWPLWDKKNQTLTDKFARTVVLRPTSD
ncbi:MAG: RDD family protein [Acidimicrobiales bacterium]